MHALQREPYSTIEVFASLYSLPYIRFPKAYSLNRYSPFSRCLTLPSVWKTYPRSFG